MTTAYGRDLDLNLLRVFVVVADTGSATAAAARLYITQPAISAALKRLHDAVGAALFVRQGRGLVLTARGQRLLAAVRPHLGALVDAALSPPTFDPKTSDRVFRIGLSDAGELWLLPLLLRRLARDAPRVRIIAVPVQFRTIGDVLKDGAVDAAVTVADELPSSVRRRALMRGGFVCVFDPRHVDLGRAGKLTMERYLAHDHVIVSYAGDLRGVVEDVLGIERRVRVSVSSFHGVGAILDGSALIATVPQIVAAELVRTHPRLVTAKKPFRLAPDDPSSSAPGLELLWPTSVDDDDANRFLRDRIVAVAAARS